MFESSQAQAHSGQPKLTPTAEAGLQVAHEHFQFGNPLLQRGNAGIALLISGTTRPAHAISTGKRAGATGACRIV
jgi:hypothetical protein